MFLLSILSMASLKSTKIVPQNNGSQRMSVKLRHWLRFYLETDSLFLNMPCRSSSDFVGFDRTSCYWAAFINHSIVRFRSFRDAILKYRPDFLDMVLRKGSDVNSEQVSKWLCHAVRYMETNKGTVSEFSNCHA